MTVLIIVLALISIFSFALVLAARALPEPQHRRTDEPWIIGFVRSGGLEQQPQERKEEDK